MRLLVGIGKFAEQLLSGLNVGVVCLFWRIKRAKHDIFALVFDVCLKSLFHWSNALKSRSVIRRTFSVHHVLTRCTKPQVLAAIIKSITVDVIALFTSAQRTPDHPFKNDTVHTDHCSFALLPESLGGITRRYAPIQHSQISITRGDKSNQSFGNWYLDWIKQGKLSILDHGSLLDRLLDPRLLLQSVGDLLYYNASLNVRTQLNG